MKKNIVTLAAANLAIGLVEFVFNMYLSRVLGAEGLGTLSLVSPINCLFLSFMTEGLVVTISKISARNQHFGDTGAMYRTVQVSTVFSFLWSVFLCFVVVLSAILWQGLVTKKKLAALGLTLVGCALVCGLFAGDLTVNLPGIMLGLGAGFFYALYSIFGRYALDHYGSMTVTVWTFLFAGPASLVLLRPSELAGAFSAPGTWLTAAGLVVFSTVLPYILYTRGLSQVESGKASIMASLEPVVASLAGVLVFGEPMSGFTLAGIVCVLAGVYILR